MELFTWNTGSVCFTLESISLLAFEICHSPYKFGCVTAFHIWTVDIRVSAMTASDKPLWSQKGCMNFLSVRSWFLVMSFVVHVSLVFGSFRFPPLVACPVACPVFLYGVLRVGWVGGSFVGGVHVVFHRSWLHLRLQTFVMPILIWCRICTLKLSVVSCSLSKQQSLVMKSFSSCADT